MAPHTPLRRKAKTDFVLQTIRSHIVSGELSPGDRLPTRRELNEAFDASSMTVQRVFQRLINEGFVEAHGARGTFVAARPPHLARFGLVFDSWLSGHRFEFPHNLATAATTLQHEPPIEFPHYEHIVIDADHVSIRELRRDIARHRLAGLLYTFNPTLVLERTAWLREAALPSVAIGHNLRTDAGSGHCPAVYVDYAAFIDRAFEALARQGCKRPAVINSLYQTLAYGEDVFIAAAARHGLTLDPHWVLPLPPSGVQGVFACIRLLSQVPAETRPDALLLTDDHYVDPAMGGLSFAGIRVPQEMRIVAHANFPQARPSSLPVQRLGFDGRKLLSLCVDTVDRQSRGENVPDQQLLAPEWEHEDSLNQVSVPVVAARHQLAAVK